MSPVSLLPHLVQLITKSVSVCKYRTGFVGVLLPVNRTGMPSHVEISVRMYFCSTGT